MIIILTTPLIPVQWLLYTSPAHLQSSGGCQYSWVVSQWQTGGVWGRELEGEILGVVTLLWIHGVGKVTCFCV